MRVGGAFFYSLVSTIDLLLSALVWFVFVWVILSWVVFIMSQTSFRWRHRGAFNILFQINDMFTRVTNPILKPFRRLLPPWRTGGVDVSPMLLFLVIYFIRTFLRLAVY